MKEKVICIGLQRTATTSVGAALRYLGYNHLSYKKEHHNLYRQNDIKSLIKLADDYDSFDDNPWCHLYKEFDHKYNNVKFILTIRKDAETWYKSICNLHDILGPRKGVVPPYKRKDELIKEYINHNQNVINYFSGTDKLIVISFEKGDGWKQICEFLGQPIPDIPFPHAHKTPSSLTKLPKPIKLLLRIPIIGLVFHYSRRHFSKICKKNK